MALGERRAAPKVWRKPLWVAVITISGLLSGLLADGWADVWSWVALAVPLGLVLVSTLNRRM